MIIQEVIVFIGNLLVHHITLNEMNHRRLGSIMQHHQRVSSLIHGPIVRIRDIFLFQNLHIVERLKCRTATHGITLNRSSTGVGGT